MTKITACLFASLALAALAGCQQETKTASTRKTGTYGGARHMKVGSNIPQRESVDATGATYDPEQFQTLQTQQSTVGIQRN